METNTELVKLFERYFLLTLFLFVIVVSQILNNFFRKIYKYKSFETSIL